MTLAGPNSRYLSDLPFREQLSRIGQLACHLKAFLARYDFEPRTLDHFLRKESLLEQIQSLETTRYRVWEQLNRKKGSPEGLKGQMASLHREFRELEARVHAYAGSCPSGVPGCSSPGDSGISTDARIPPTRETTMIERESHSGTST